MRNYSTYKIVYDRKDKKDKKGLALVQIEIHLSDGSRKYVSTGLKIPESEWDSKTRQIIGSPFATRLNNQIAEKIAKIRSHELILIEKNIRLTANEVTLALGEKDTGSFVAFMRDQIAARNDIAPGTRFLHTRVANRLEQHGIIRYSYPYGHEHLFQLMRYDYFCPGRSVCS